MNNLSAIWTNARPEIIVIAVVFVLGMGWGALGAHLLRDPRRGWE